MSRQKEFNVEEALDRALDLFWSRGYEATSMRDLVEHVGVNPGSMYATFGGKRELYLKALERYRTLTNEPMVAELGESGPVKPKLRQVLVSLAEDALGDPERRGCMVVNTACEMVPRDDEVERRVARSFSNVEDAMRRAIERAQRRGEIDAAKDPQALARFLLTMIQGLRVVGKATPERARLEDSIDVALGTLD